MLIIHSVIYTFCNLYSANYTFCNLYSANYTFCTLHSTNYTVSNEHYNKGVIFIAVLLLVFVFYITTSFLFQFKITNDSKFVLLFSFNIFYYSRTYNYNNLIEIQNYETSSLIKYTHGSLKLYTCTFLPLT